MAIDLGEQQSVFLVADADTPTNLAQWAGRTVSIPIDARLPELGKPDYLTGGPIGTAKLWGFLRRDVDNHLQWVMRAPINPVVTAVDSIPTAGAWTDQDARTTYLTVFHQMQGLGVSLIPIRTAEKALYDAAIADFVAAHPPTP